MVIKFTKFVIDSQFTLRGMMVSLVSHGSFCVSAFNIPADHFSWTIDVKQIIYSIKNKSNKK